MAQWVSASSADPDADDGFRETDRATAKRLDMRKSCVRFCTLDDLPLDLMAATLAEAGVDDFLALDDAAREQP